MAYSAPAPHEPNAVDRMVSVVDLLETPDLARIYTYLQRTENDPTTEAVIEDLGIAQTTAYESLTHLVETGLVDRTTETRPYHYQANPVELQVAIDGEESETAYAITPMLIDAIGQSVNNENIALYLDRNGIGGLADALIYTIEHREGYVTTQIMARELDLSVLEAGTILAELRDIVQTWNPEGVQSDDDVSEHRV
jgi:predicted transcriptional regulator